MLDIWKEVERTERAVTEASSDVTYTEALKELEDALQRYTDKVRECIDRGQMPEPER